MSGIYGFFNKFAQDNNLDNRLKTWNKIYGQFKNESRTYGKITLGCCLEHITDTPCPDSVIIELSGQIYIIDAIIYNRDELLEQIYMSNETDYSDELLLATYISQKGLSSLRNVNGDFSGAILSNDLSCMTLFRDHMGIRPLYYYSDEDEIFFSTDIRGITSIPHLDMSVNEIYLYKMLSGHANLSTTETEYSNIHCVIPGGYIIFDLSSDKIKTERNYYWRPGERKIRFVNDCEYITELRKLITDSINRRLMTYKTGIGAELSGGLDSGVIDILINRLGYDCKFFSWSYDPQDVPIAPHDERSKIIDICNQEHISCVYRKYNTPSDYIDGISAYYSQNLKVNTDKNINVAIRNVFPQSTNTILIRDALDHLKSAGCKVVFTGHGGDEGVSHRPTPHELFYAGEYYHYIKCMWSESHGRKRRISYWINSIKKDISNEQLNSKIFYNEAAPLLNSSFKEKMAHIQPESHIFFYNPIEYVRSGGSRGRLDNVAMYSSYYQMRYVAPFLDYRVIDYAVSIPRHMYIKNGIRRYIFREAFKDILPKSLYLSSRKMDGSYVNVENDDDWFELFDIDRRDFIARIDREYWGKYIDFDFIDKWLEEGKPSIEDESKFKLIYSFILRIALIENTVTQSRMLTD